MEYSGGIRSPTAIKMHHMMTSTNGNIFRVTGYLCGNSPVPVNSPHQVQWRGALMFSLICTRINGWVNNGEAGDLRRNRDHYDVTVMRWVSISFQRTAKCSILGPGSVRQSHEERLRDAMIDWLDWLDCLEIWQALRWHKCCLTVCYSSEWSNSPAVCRAFKSYNKTSY